KGKQIEERQITVTTPNILAAPFDNHAYVYNVAGLRVYQMSEIGYSPSEANRSRKETYTIDPFFEVDGIDYMFREAPDTIQMSSSSSVEYKKSLEPLMKTTLYDYARFRYNDNDFAEAEKAYRAISAWHKCDIQARRGLSM